MHTTTHPLSPPPLQELASILQPTLQSNYSTSSITITQCPDLSQPPFHLASPGLSGNESIADIGGQPNLFPTPLLSKTWSLLQTAKATNLPSSSGQLLGAGAGPFHHIGMNSELAPNLSWKDGFENVNNLSHYTKIENGTVTCAKSPSCDCALMINLYGSSGLPGPVLKITARGRTGSQASFTELLRSTLANHYGPNQPISIGGVFLLKRGKAKSHVMPDFPPPDQLPFKDGEQVNNWLTFHDFSAPMVCLTVFHTADPEKLDLRMEHTHCFSPDGANTGGHYHGDLDGEGEEVEYEAYLNTAKTLYRIDKPENVVDRKWHK